MKAVELPTSFEVEHSRYLSIQTGMLGLFFVGLLVGGIANLALGERRVFPALFLFLMAGFVGFMFLRFLRVPRRIRIDAGGRIELSGPLFRVLLRPSEIAWIGPTQEPGFFVIKHHGGAVRFFHQFTGFHEFLVWLKQVNPSVVIKGC